MPHILETLWHTLKETLPLLPFLYATYLLMELLERYAGDRAQKVIRRAGAAGPLLGGALGVIPQCGFSASGAGFYAARLITPGTLLALFLSTSDEMLPVMLSASVAPGRIASILLVKVVIAVSVGFATDGILGLISRKKATSSTNDDDALAHIGDLCESGHCHCEHRRAPVAALIHTASVALVIYIVSALLHAIMHHGGEALIARVASLPPIVVCLVTSLVGMIPSCASSVALTQLHLGGGLSIGALMAGLLTGAGVGLIVLLRTNRPRKNTLLLLAVLYVVGVAAGTLIDLTPLAAWLS
jgi:hypothetical protein